MSATIQTTPPIGQKKQIACISRAGTETLVSVEQIPAVNQLLFAAICIVKEAKESIEAEESAEAAS